MHEYLGGGERLEGRQGSGCERAHAESLQRVEETVKGGCRSRLRRRTALGQRRSSVGWLACRWLRRRNRGGCRVDLPRNELLFVESEHCRKSPISSLPLAQLQSTLQPIRDRPRAYPLRHRPSW